MLEITIILLFAYFLWRAIFRLAFPQKFFRLKVLKIYEFQPNTIETILEINQYSKITNIYATESSNIPPDQNHHYEIYKTINNVETGSGFMIDTRTGTLFTRCVLWEKK